MSNWECNNCNKVHRKNVSKCNACSHTILQQTAEEPDSLLAKFLSKLGL